MVTKKRRSTNYGVYLSENGTMLADKYFDVNTNDFVIVDEVKYKGTLGLYKLIFKRIPDDTENDKLAYKNILLAMLIGTVIKWIIE